MMIALAFLTLAAQQAPAPEASARPKFPYWQQEVAYEITARLDESSGVLAGTERISYTNRSPDTLTTFALHLHLNAFRPGSRWADSDSAEGRRRFNDLEDPDFAFNHVRNVRIMGQAVEPIYPFAPDSTIVRFDLPRPLLPGESLTVDMDWDARPSTLPRRQGRQGRRFDFAQWYPKVVVYDRYGWAEHPLFPGGEFYGEFAAYRVTLDVAEDQVVGATGVAVCGDPGWERVNRTSGLTVDYQRDYYGAATESFSDVCAAPAADRKHIVWYAEDVHHFAMSLNPDYRYEGGEYGDVAVHVLYQPGDEETWGNGVAVERTETALAWLDQLYGKFAWPQVTNVHRIEGGGTEFPMMMHNGSASQGLIVHELGHNYTMGILANNEWREGWLDEGISSFQTSWFMETAGEGDAYPGTEQFILGLDLDGFSEPASLVSEHYRDFTSYNISIYTRGELFFHQLRYIVGDETMRRILRTFYDRWKLKHVDEAAFRAVAEEVSGKDLSTFFGQFLHATLLYDYGVGDAERRELPDGRWLTRVEVVRHEDGRMPLDVAVIADGDTAVVRIDGAAARQWVEIETAAKPERVSLDPRVRSHDWNMLNNHRRLGGWPTSFLSDDAPTDHYFDTYFNRRISRSGRTTGYAPTVWYNDVGGVTVGLRRRSNYLGRFDLLDLQSSYGTGWESDPALEERDSDWSVRLRNPTWLRSTNLSQTFEGFRTEGRYGGKIAVEWARRAHLSFGPIHRTGIALSWVTVEDERYVDPGYYEPVGTVELSLAQGVTRQAGRWALTLDASAAGGLAYAEEGLDVATGRSTDALYGRFIVGATARRPLGTRTSIGARLFAGSVSDSAVMQRRIYLAGAGPYEQLGNPFVRSRGALFIRDELYYHTPGGAGIRGLDPRISAATAAGFSLELEHTVHRRQTGIFNRVAIAAFGDAGVAYDESAALTGDETVFLADAGIGLRADHRIGTMRFTTRLDFPIWINRGGLAYDVEAGQEDLGFRWLFSFAPAL